MSGSTKIMFSSHVKLIVLLIIAFLFYMIYLAFHQGVGNLYSQKATISMQAWSKKQTLVSDTDWNATLEDLQKALTHSPNNPDYLALMGNLYEWRVVGDKLSYAESTEIYEKALVYYQQALQYRPAYAFYWANIVVVKSRLGNIDKSFFTAVHRALALGSWEPGVQLKIADAMLNVWYLLDEKSWETMVMIIDKGLKSNAAQIMQIAKDVNVRNKLCGKLRRTPEMLQYCK